MMNPPERISSSQLDQILTLSGDDFLQAAYRIVLGRPIDDVGLAHYQAKLQAGTEPAQIIVQLRQSREGRAFAAAMQQVERLAERHRKMRNPFLGPFLKMIGYKLYSLGNQNHAVAPERSRQADTSSISLNRLLSLSGDEFLRAAYLKVLGRPADEAGLATYRDAIRSGAEPAQVLVDLRASGEGRAYGVEMPAIDRLVARSRRLRNPVLRPFLRAIGYKLYHQPIYLDRLPQANAQVGHGPAGSVEELLSYYDEDFVRIAYLTLLRREPDAEGLATFVARTRSGEDRLALLSKLADSPEGRGLAEGEGSLKRLAHSIRAHLLKEKGQPRLGRDSAQLRAVSNQLYRIESLQHRSDMSGEGHLAAALTSIADQNRITNAKLEQALDLLLQGGGHRAGTSAATPRLELSMASATPARTAPIPRPQTIYYYVDHTIRCPVNTGMQRLTRHLARGLLERGETLRFIKWDLEAKTFALINQLELKHLSQWEGPVFSDQELMFYPEIGGAIVDFTQAVGDKWFFSPEVTHITYHPSDVTLDVFMAARSANLRMAYVYYDAIPLRHSAYADTTEAHEKYMQILLLADLILPISNRSSEELRAFFVHRQRALSLPHIIPTVLPGQSNLVERETVAAESVSEKLILSVGSIDPRKNQLSLVAAFDKFSKTPPGEGWTLMLAGNLHGGVAGTLQAALAANPNVIYVPHPSDEELERLYRRADFTVFPSIEEGFGLPILESLWFGKPCICANFGAMAEVADGGGCLTVDTRDQNEIYSALVRLAEDQSLFKRLALLAVHRRMSTWLDYASDIDRALRRVADPVSRVPAIYYWIDQTPQQPFNTGVQRVVRQLARAFMARGVQIVPVKFDRRKQRIIPACQADLRAMSGWNGPPADAWADWVEPGSIGAPRWLFVAEIAHIQMAQIKLKAEQLDLRCATIFYDAIPYKMTEFFHGEWQRNHATYMLDLGNYDKIYAISRTSRDDLWDFLLSRPEPTPGVDHRLVATPLPTELPGAPRETTVKRADGKTVNILCVGSIEARKNQIQLVRSFKQATTTCRRMLNLIFIGRSMPGNEALAEGFRQEVSEAPGVSWLENVDDAELRRLYLQSDFTVYCSLEEGFGLPIAESLWNGRPCLVHDKNATAELAVGGGCMTVDMRDRDALTEMIVKLAEDDDLRYRLASELINRKIRTWDDYASEILNDMAEDHVSKSRVAVPKSSQRDSTGLITNQPPRPILSLCFSTYNRADWLNLTLRNSLDQLTIIDLEIEILVVDNASTDNTEEVVGRYFDHPRFRYVRNPKNVGMLGNLAVTANAARGEYIWILGDDDFIRPGGLRRVVDSIREHPGIALVYPNYAYTTEEDPKAVSDLDAFLEACPPIVKPSEDEYATVADVAVKNENLFSAIYALILRRDHALHAYTQNTSGRPFSSMRTAIPTTYYVLNYMMEEEALWIGAPIVVVNFNVSWNRYASLFILERFPEAHDLAQRMGADPDLLRRWRTHFTNGVPHYWHELYQNDVEDNWRYFAADRAVMRLKGLLTPDQLNTMASMYNHFRSVSHPAATMPTAQLFRAFGLQGFD